MSVFPGGAPALTARKASDPWSTLAAVAVGLTIFAASLGTPFGAILVFYSLALITAVLMRPAPFLDTCLMVAGALVLRYAASYLVPLVIIFDDEMGYARMANNVVDALKYRRGNPWDLNPWSNVTAVLFYAFGDAKEVVKAGNAYLGVLAAFVAWKAALRMYPEDRRVAEWTLRLLLFLPAFLVISSVALKEQLMGTLIILLLAGTCMRTRPGALLALLALAGIWIFRSSLAAVVTVVVAAYAVALVFRNPSVSSILKSMLAGFLVSCFLAGGVLLVKTSFGSRLKIVLIVSGKDKRGLEAMANNTARFAEHLDTENPFSPKNLVLAPLRSVFSPSPLRPIKSPGAPVFLEAVTMTLFLYLGVPYVILAMLGAGRDPARWLAAGLFLSVFVTASLAILSFAPETFRYRWADFPIYFMMAAAGWFLGPKKWRRTVVWGWWLAAGLFSAVYLA